MASYQGLTLEQMLSNVFVSELDEGTRCFLSTLAGDYGMMGAIRWEIRETVQRDLNSLGEWAGT